MGYWRDSFWDELQKGEGHREREFELKVEPKLSPREVVERMPKMMRVMLLLYKGWWSPSDLANKFHDDGYKRALYRLCKFMLDRRIEKTEWGWKIYYTIKRKYRPHVYRYFIKRFGYDPYTLLRYL